MKRILKYALILATFSSCSKPNPKDDFISFYRSIPVVASAPMIEPSEASNRRRQKIQIPASVTSLRDLLPVSKFVQLEVSERSIVGDITGVIHLDGYYVIWDRIQNQIYKFDEKGKFSGLIGRPGEGPEEYLKISMITAVYERNLAVIDGMRGHVLVYDLDGNLLRKTAPPRSRGDGGKFPITCAIIWNQEDRLFLSDFDAYDSGAPYHVVLDYATPEGKLLFGFGNRFAEYEHWTVQGKASRPKYSGCFREIGGRIWAANPLLSDIQIYERDGSHYRTVRAAHPDNITEQDYFQVKPGISAFQKVRHHKMTNLCLVGVKDLVFQFVNKSKEHLVNVYDLEGNLLRSRLKADILSILAMNAEGDTLVCGVPVLEQHSFYERCLTADEMSLLRSSGWKPEQLNDANPMICVRKAAW